MSVDSILVYYCVLLYDFSSIYSLLDIVKFEKIFEGLFVGIYNFYVWEGGFFDG